MEMSLTIGTHEKSVSIGNKMTTLAGSCRFGEDAKVASPPIPSMMTVPVSRIRRTGIGILATRSSISDMSCTSDLCANLDTGDQVYIPIYALHIGTVTTCIE